MNDEEHNPLSEIPLFVKTARAKLGKTQEEFAEMYNCTKGNVSAWENARHEPAYALLRDMAERSGIPLPQSALTSHPLDTEKQENTEPGPSITGKVPLISWVQAGDFKQIIDEFSSESYEDTVHATVCVNQYTFALRVKGDSMEPDFPEGIIIIVEPEMDFQPGDFVIARTGDEAVFKQIVKDGSDWYLKPLNPRYPIKPLGNAQIIGVVREAIRKFR
jgi:SOS-response transcriptional repressor LexA